MTFWSRGDDVIDSLIKPPRSVYAGHDERKAAAADQRRQLADSLRKRSALVASGSASVLQMVKKA